jgi:hypothetical protein
MALAVSKCHFSPPPHCLLVLMKKNFKWIYDLRFTITIRKNTPFLPFLILR